MMAKSSEKVCCVAALSVKTNVFVRTQRWSHEALEPHARVAHVRDADKTSYGTLREKITCART